MSMRFCSFLLAKLNSRVLSTRLKRHFRFVQLQHARQPSTSAQPCMPCFSTKALNTPTSSKWEWSDECEEGREYRPVSLSPSDQTAIDEYHCRIQFRLPRIYTEAIVKNAENMLQMTQTMVTDRKRYAGQRFLVDILLPLESGQNELCNFLRSPAGNRFCPFLIELCGRTMSDQPMAIKQEWERRLWKVLMRQEIKPTIEMLNARLAVWLENETMITDDTIILSTIQEKYELKPDLRTFLLLIYHVAMRGDVNKIKFFRNLAAEYSCSINQISVVSAMIFALCKKMDLANAELHVKKLVARQGDSVKPTAIGALLRGVSAVGDFNRVERILRDSEVLNTIPSSNVQNVIINIPPLTLMDVIWNLAKLSKSVGAKDLFNATLQLFRKMKSEEGLNKYRLREAQRHLTVGNFYISLAILENFSEGVTQRDTALHKELLTIIGRLMVSKNLPLLELIAVMKRGEEKLLRGDYLCRSIVQAVISYQNYSTDTKMRYLKELLPFVDPNRDRFHLIYPILISIDREDVQLRFAVLQQWLKCGYDEKSVFNTTDESFIAWIFVVPLFANHDIKSTVNLKEIERIMENQGFDLQFMRSLFQKWSNLRHHTGFTLPNSVEADGKDDVNFHIDDFFSNLCKATDPSKLSETLEKRSRLLSTDDIGKIAWQEHLLPLISSYFTLTGNDPAETMKFLEQVHRLFPEAPIPKPNLAWRHLIRLYRIAGGEFSIDQVMAFVNLMGKMNRLNIALFNTEYEPVSKTIMADVVERFGYVWAMKVLFVMNTNLGVTAGVLHVLQFAIGDEKDPEAVNKVLFKASNFVSPKKMALYHLFALLLHGRTDEARRLMEKTNLLEQNDMHPLIQGIRFVFTNTATHGEFVDFLLRYVEFLLSEMSTAIAMQPNIADKLQSEAFYYLEFSTPLTAVAASARVQNLLKLYAIFKRFAIPMRMDQLRMVVEARLKNAAFGKTSIEQKKRISHLLSELRTEAEQQKSKGTQKAIGTTIAGDKRAWNTVG